MDSGLFWNGVFSARVAGRGLSPGLDRERHGAEVARQRDDTHPGTRPLTIGLGVDGAGRQNAQDRDDVSGPHVSSSSGRYCDDLGCV